MSGSRYNVSTLYRKAELRVWYNGRTSAFQADDEGSIPSTRSNLERFVADIAQLVECILGKDEVGSSNLPISTSIQHRR